MVRVRMLLLLQNTMHALHQLCRLQLAPSAVSVSVRASWLPFGEEG
jgi:hypothetical protein